MKRIAAIAAAGAFALCAPLWAGTADAPHAHLHGAEAAGVKTSMADGEVRKVERAAGKLTLKHGPIANLDMPPMTMAFRVKDAAMLDRLQPGDRIRFAAERIDGAYVVVRIEPVK